MGAYQPVRDAAIALEDAFNAFEAATATYNSKFDEAVALIPTEQSALEAAQEAWATAFASASATVGLGSQEDAVNAAQTVLDDALVTFQELAKIHIPS